MAIKTPWESLTVSDLNQPINCVSNNILYRAHLTYLLIYFYRTQMVDSYFRLNVMCF